MFRISYYTLFLITLLLITFTDSVQSENSTQFWNETVFEEYVIERENSDTIMCLVCNDGEFKKKCDNEQYRHEEECEGACAIDYYRRSYLIGGWTISKIFLS